jgi:hypothetical protein
LDRILFGFFPVLEDDDDDDDDDSWHLESDLLKDDTVQVVDGEIQASQTKRRRARYNTWRQDIMVGCGSLLS